MTAVPKRATEAQTRKKRLKEGGEQGRDPQKNDQKPTKSTEAQGPQQIRIDCLQVPTDHTTRTMQQALQDETTVDLEGSRGQVGWEGGGRKTV